MEAKANVILESSIVFYNLFDIFLPIYIQLNYIDLKVIPAYKL